MKFVKNLENRELLSSHLDKLVIFLGALMLILGAGCEVPIRWEAPEYPTQASTSSLSVAPSWEEIELGVERFDGRVSSSGVGARMIIWRFSSEADVTWSLATSTNPQPVSAWIDNNTTSTIFAVNAGYFHEDGLPSGWVSILGQRWGKRSFDESKSGIVRLGARPTVVLGSAPTSSFSVDAFQSYPFLLKAGEPAFLRETGQYARRTFVGTDAEHRWYVGVVPNESITLFQLVNLLETMPIRWDHVLNLDGGPSTGLVTRMTSQEDRTDSFAPVSYVIIAKRRP